MASESRRVRLWQGRIETEVVVEGSGPPLVYLHGPWGLDRDRPFVSRLAATHTVHAPRHPGTTSRDADAVHRLDDWLDLVVYYGELLDALGLSAIPVAGHSFGALAAAEIACAMPRLISKLVLIDPVGLWRDEAPVRNWMILPDAERRSVLFADPKGEAADAFFRLPNDPAQRAEALTAMVWSQACTGKFVWPIPDRGLKDRLHRIAAPTLLVWGKADAIVPTSYAEDFAKAIKAARIAVLDGAGHMAHLERGEAAAKVIADFLKG